MIDLDIIPTDSGYRIKGKDTNGNAVEHTIEKGASGNTSTHTNYADGSERSTGSFGITTIKIIGHDADGKPLTEISITTKSGVIIHQDAQGNFTNKTPVGTDANGNIEYDVTVGTKNSNGSWDKETSHPDGSIDYEYKGGSTHVSPDGGTTTVSLKNGMTIVQDSSGYRVTNSDGEVIARGTDSYDYSNDGQGNSEWNYKDGSQTNVSGDGSINIRLPDGSSLNQSDTRSVWTQADGSKTVSIKDTNGDWQTQNYASGYKEDINDLFDPDGDGVGAWDGSMESFATADFDSMTWRLDQGLFVAVNSVHWLQMA